MSPSKIKRKYEKRILAILNRYRDALVAAGFDVDEPSDMTCDYFQWSMNVKFEGMEDVGIDFKIAESEYWDGEKGGVNFMLDIVAMGGLILGGLAPYNYTDDCWVPRKDDEAIDRRFRIMEDASEYADEVVRLIEAHKNKKEVANA